MRKDNAVISPNAKQVFGGLAILFGVWFLSYCLRIGVSLATGDGVSEALKDENGESDFIVFKMTFWITLACLLLWLVLPKKVTQKK